MTYKNVVRRVLVVQSELLDVSDVAMSHCTSEFLYHFLNQLPLVSLRISQSLYMLLIIVTHVNETFSFMTETRPRRLKFCFRRDRDVETETSSLIIVEPLWRHRHLLLAAQ